MSNETSEENPQVEKLFAPIPKRLTTKELQELNAKVDVEGQLEDQVAEGWLSENRVIWQRARPDGRAFSRLSRVLLNRQRPRIRGFRNRRRYRRSSSRATNLGTARPASRNLPKPL